MKNLFNRYVSNILVAALSALFLTACPPKPTGDPVKLTVIPEELEFDAANAEEQFVDVITNAKTWAATTSARWIDIEEMPDGFYVTVDDYTDTEKERTGRITVRTDGADPVIVNVTQFAAKAQANTLIVQPTSFIYAANETGAKTAGITTNAASWNFAMTAVDWLTPEKIDNTLKLTVNSMNTASQERSANIVITAGNADPVNLSVTQMGGVAPNTLTVNLSSLYFAAGEINTKTATISTNASNWNASTPADWLTLQMEDYTLSVTPKSLNTGSSQRVDYITVTAGNADPVDIAVTQEPTETNTLSVNPESINFSAGETAAKTATISTNAANWNASTPADWLTLQMEGYTLSVTPKSLNTGSSQRVANITVTAGDADPVNIAVTQEPTISPTIDPNKLPGAWQAVKFVENDGTTTTYPIGGTTNILFTLNSNGTYVWDVQSSTPGVLKVEHRGTWTYSTADRMLKINGTMYIGGSVFSAVDESFQMEELTDDLLVALQTTGSKTPTWTFQKSTGPSFNDIVESSYKATGTPYQTANPAPNEWDGLIVPQDGYPVYGVFDWANFDLPMFLEYDGGKIVLMDDIKVGDYESYDLYFTAGYISGSVMQYVPEYEVNYNKSTNTLDFSGTVNGNQVYVGIWGQHKTTNTWTIFTNTQLRGAKLVLTPLSSTSLRSGSKSLSENRSIFQKIRPSSATNKIKLDNSKPVKIPLNEMKQLDRQSVRPVQGR